MLQNSILEAIGQTPLVRLNNLATRLPCEFYAKCEFLNPGGSSKDRIAAAMVEQAEASGRIRPGDTLIEATSGNTGIGLAMVGAVKGYQVIITMPEKMSLEKEVVITALGARIVRTPTDVSYDDPRSHIEVAKKLCRETPRAHILDQYVNPANPDIHARATAVEVLKDLPYFDVMVIAAGTGGTISGCAKTLKDALPQCQIVGVDPVGSILAGPGEVAGYEVEGIGYDFIPKTLKQQAVDHWEKTNDPESFEAARLLIRHEGLLVGGSSGAAFAGAQKACRRMGLGPKNRCVVLFADGVRNYMSKFVHDRWMTERSYFLPTDKP